MFKYKLPNEQTKNVSFVDLKKGVLTGGLKHMKKIIVTLLIGMLVFASGNITVYANTAKKGASLPGKAQIVSSYKGVSKVKLRWRKVKGADGYKIYMKKGAGYKCIDTIRNSSVITYTIKELKSGTTYQFKVRAYKKNKGKVLFGKNSSVKKITTKYGLSNGHFSCKYYSFNFDSTIWDVDEYYPDQEMIRIKKKMQPGEEKLPWEERENLKKPQIEITICSLNGVTTKITTVNEYLNWQFKDWEDTVGAPKYNKYGKIKIADKNFVVYGNDRGFSRTYVTLIDDKIGKKKVKVALHIQLSYDSDNHTAFDKYYYKVLNSLKLNTRK